MPEDTHTLLGLGNLILGKCFHDFKSKSNTNMSSVSLPAKPPSRKIFFPHLDATRLAPPLPAISR